MRYLFIILGFTCLILGMIGVFVPLLPTTPLILLSAFCFARSSEKLHTWLITHKRFGTVIKDWQERGSINKKAKIIAMIMIILSPIIAYKFEVPTAALIIQIIILSCVSLFILTRPSS